MGDSKTTLHSSSSESLKHESAKRIFRLLQFLVANECTRSDVFDYLASYYKIDETLPIEGTRSRRAERMFERDIEFLRDQDFEITSIRKHGHPTRYSLAKGSGPRTPFLFTQSDVDNLALLHNLFANPTRYAELEPTQLLPQQPPRNPFAQEMNLTRYRRVSTGWI